MKKRAPKPSSLASSTTWLDHPGLSADRKKLHKQCKSAGILDSLPNIEAFARPAISLLVKKRAPKELCVGRIGGAPDFPPSMDWPVAAKRPLGFVAQLDLNALAAFDLQNELPKEGLLSFFAALDPNKPRYGSAAVVCHATGPMTPRSNPTPWGSKTVGWLIPKLRLSLPYHEDEACERVGLSDDDRESYHDEVFLAFAPDEHAHQVLGYGTQGTGPGIEGHRLLAQFDSDDRIDFDVGDYETLRFFVEPTAFRSFDLAKVTCTMEMA